MIMAALNGRRRPSGYERRGLPSAAARALFSEYPTTSVGLSSSVVASPQPYDQATGLREWLRRPEATAGAGDVADRRQACAHLRHSMKSTSDNFCSRLAERVPPATPVPGQRRQRRIRPVRMGAPRHWQGLRGQARCRQRIARLRELPTGLDDNLTDDVHIAVLGPAPPTGCAFGGGTAAFAQSPGASLAVSTGQSSRGGGAAGSGGIHLRPAHLSGYRERQSLLGSWVPRPSRDSKPIADRQMFRRRVGGPPLEEGLCVIEAAAAKAAAISSYTMSRGIRGR